MFSGVEVGRGTGHGLFIDGRSFVLIVVYMRLIGSLSDSLLLLLSYLSHSRGSRITHMFQGGFSMFAALFLIL